MRKIVLLIAVLLMAVPAMASDVDIDCSVDGNAVTVEYSSDVNLVRAFGLIITLDDPNAAITKVDSVNANYRIYPGHIVIDYGEITDYNLPYAVDDLGDANLAIEMGSLYTTDADYEDDPNAGYDMVPGSSGTLLRFYVVGPNGAEADDICFDVNEDPVTGGVVMEDPCQAIEVNSPGGCIGGGKCYDGQPDYDEWVAVGEPNCWCHPRQCHGDADGEAQGGSKTGYWYVGTDDLNTLVSAWQILEPAEAPTPSGPGLSGDQICADFDHEKQGGSKTGYWRVGTDDLNRLVAAWQILEPAEAPTPSGPGVDPDCLD